jgi:hypothetical protein
MFQGAYYIDGVRIPEPSEVPGYPWLQEALQRNKTAESGTP